MTFTSLGLLSLYICKQNYDLPEPINNIHCQNSDVHSNETRQQADFHVKKYVIDEARRGFVYKSPLLWTSLPDTVKYAKTIKCFGLQFRKYICKPYRWCT